MISHYLDSAGVENAGYLLTHEGYSIRSLIPSELLRFITKTVIPQTEHVARHSTKHPLVVVRKEIDYGCDDETGDEYMFPIYTVARNLSGTRGISLEGVLEWFLAAQSMSDIRTPESVVLAGHVLVCLYLCLLSENVPICEFQDLEAFENHRGRAMTLWEIKQSLKSVSRPSFQHVGYDAASGERTYRPLPDFVRSRPYPFDDPEEDEEYEVFYRL